MAEKHQLYSCYLGISGINRQPSTGTGKLNIPIIGYYRIARNFRVVTRYIEKKTSLWDVVFSIYLGRMYVVPGGWGLGCCGVCVLVIERARAPQSSREKAACNFTSLCRN